MMPTDPKDDLANDWFNGFLPKLQFEQDYNIYPGSSKKLLNDDGTEYGISITRADVRLYPTGITKLYEMIVENKDISDVEYAPEQEKKFEENMKNKWPEVFEQELLNGQ